MPAWTDRRSVLRAFGATQAECTELLRYNENHFEAAGLERSGPLPLADEPFVATWERYAREAAREGAWPVLRRALVQLRFPVREGMSREPAYEAATRSPVPVSDRVAPLRLQRPGGLRIAIHATPAGRLPVLIAACRKDFESLMQALTKRNEPVPVLSSVGACMVAGYTNVERLRRLKDRWWNTQPFPTEAGWRRKLRELLLQGELYRDRFVIASTTPYSAIPADCLGLDIGSWERLSLTIRIEHESTHYFTRRVFGSMKNRLLDELIADYAGIVRATGRFRADWALHFLGLESYPDYRSGGRLDHYRGEPPLSDGAFRVLQRLVKRAVENLEGWSATGDDGTRPDGHIRTVVAMTTLTVEELAAADAVQHLRAVARAGAPHVGRAPWPVHARPS